jgi:hypothetical protein
MSDLQKYYVIKYKKGLITDGFFKMTRNPNYLGEVLIYNSFAIIVNRSEFWVILAFAYAIIFGLRMLIKDYSLSKKEGWNEYDSYFFFPKFSTSEVDNYVIYFTFAAFILAVYSSGGIPEFWTLFIEGSFCGIWHNMIQTIKNSCICATVEKYLHQFQK